MKNRHLQQKYFSVGIFAFLLSLLFCACKNFSNMALPEKVSVKTGAKYSVALGEKYYDEIGKKLGTELIDKLRENIQDVDIYKYIPNTNDDVLQYLLHKSLYNVSLDFGQYITKMDLNNILADTDVGVSFNEEITLPEINQTKDVSFDVKKITDEMGLEMGGGDASITLTNVPEAGDNTINLDTIFGSFGNTNVITTNFQYAKYIQFANDAKLKIKVEKKDANPCGPNYSIDLTVSILEQKEGETVIFKGVSTEPKNVANGGEIELPLNDGAGGKLQNNFQVVIGGTYSGGTLDLDHIHEYKLTFDMSNAKLKTIYNIDTKNYTPSDTSDDMDISGFEIPINQEVDFGTINSMIKSAVLGEGNLEIKVEKPAGWEGVSLNFESFSMTGIGLNLNQSDLSDLTGDYLLGKQMDFGSIVETNKTMDFAAPGEKKITLTGNVKLELADAAHGGATIDLGENGDNTNLAGSVKIKIDTIAKATADFADLVNFEMSETSENKKQLPEEVIKYVSKLTFGELQDGKHYKHDKNKALSSVESKGLGIKCKLLNSLPAGNDIKLEIKSNLFDMDSTNPAKWNDAEGAVIPSGGSTPQEVNWVSFPEIDFSGYATPPYIDFSVGLLTGEQTLINLRLGETYKFALSDVEFVFDWDSVELKLESTVDPINDSIDLSDFSLKEIFNNLDDSLKNITDNIEFNKLPAYFFIQKPIDSLSDIIGDVSIQGIVDVNYIDSHNSPQKKFIVGEEGVPASMKFSRPMEWPLSSQTDTFKTDIDTVDYSYRYYMEDILNDRPEKLKLGYDISLGGGQDCTIYKANLDEVKEGDSTSIAIDVAIVLPLEVELAADTEVDILKVAGMKTEEKNDLLGRESVSSTQEYASYASAVKYIRLNYNLKNTLLSGLNAEILIDDTHEGESNASKYTGIKRTVPFTVQDVSDDYIDFSSDEIEKILTNFFMPKIIVKAKSGTVKILRDGVDQEKSVGIAPMVVVQLDDSSPVCINDILKK